MPLTPTCPSLRLAPGVPTKDSTRDYPSLLTYHPRPLVQYNRRDPPPSILLLNRLLGRPSYLSPSSIEYHLSTAPHYLSPDPPVFIGPLQPTTSEYFLKTVIQFLPLFDPHVLSSLSFPISWKHDMVVYPFLYRVRQGVGETKTGTSIDDNIHVDDQKPRRNKKEQK